VAGKIGIEIHVGEGGPYYKSRALKGFNLGGTKKYGGSLKLHLGVEGNVLVQRG